MKRGLAMIVVGMDNMLMIYKKQFNSLDGTDEDCEGQQEPE